MPDTGLPNSNLVDLRSEAKYRIENRMTCANINVFYLGTGWTLDGQDTDAKISFQLAVNIWEALIDSPVTINIVAYYRDTGSPTNLGSANASYFRQLPGAEDNIVYPAALYEKLIGSSDNSTAADIFCEFNSTRDDWFFPDEIGLRTPSGQFNFTSVVLHEIGHGLGMLGFGRTRTGSGGSNVGFIRRLDDGSPSFLNDPNAVYFSPWDNFINLLGNQQILDIEDPSSQLLNAFTSGNLSSIGPITTAQNGGVNPKTYAPSPFNGGSSYSHWDEATFNGTETALMTPFLGPGESVYDPGNVTLGFMEDMGWSLCQGSLSTSDFKSAQFQISPNPFTDSIQIQLDTKVANDDYQAELIDITGKTLFEITPVKRGGQLIIDQLNELPTSLYFLKLTSITSGQSITKKIIKN